MRVEFKTFRGLLISWEELFQQACEFATQIGKDRLINISHSDSNNRVITVWYWSE